MHVDRAIPVQNVATYTTETSIDRQYFKATIPKRARR